MRSIKQLKNSDVIEINEEKFVVIENTSLVYHKENNELEMALNLIKLGEKQTIPNYRLTYIAKRPADLKFFTYDNKIKEFKEEKLKSVNLN